MTIDDRLPCLAGRLCFSRCQREDVFWLPLLEKAYAKYVWYRSGRASQAGWHQYSDCPQRPISSALGCRTLCSPQGLAASPVVLAWTLCFSDYSLSSLLTLPSHISQHSTERSSSFLSPSTKMPPCMFLNIQDKWFIACL